MVTLVVLPRTSANPVKRQARGDSGAPAEHPRVRLSMPPGPRVKTVRERRTLQVCSENVENFPLLGNNVKGRYKVCQSKWRNHQQKKKSWTT